MFLFGWYALPTSGTDLIGGTFDYNFVTKNNLPVRVGYAQTNVYRFYEPHGINGGNPK
jgi:hypothetical protein